MTGDDQEVTGTLIVRARGRKNSPSCLFLLLLLLLPLTRCQVFAEQQQVWRREGLEQEQVWRREGLEQESSCYFQPFYKQLTCKCPLGQVRPKDLQLEKPDSGELFAQFEDGILHQRGWT